MIGEIPLRFKGTIENFWSHAETMAHYETPDGVIKVLYPQIIPSESVRFTIGENGWAQAQRLPGEVCLITVGVEGEDEIMWQKLYARLERLGLWEKVLVVPQTSLPTHDTPTNGATTIHYHGTVIQPAGDVNIAGDVSGRDHIETKIENKLDDK